MSEAAKPFMLIKFLRIERIAGGGSRTGKDRFDVRFHVTYAHSACTFEIPIPIDDQAVPDEKLIPHARQKLHGLATALAEATQHWTHPADPTE